MRFYCLIHCLRSSTIRRCGMNRARAQAGCACRIVLPAAKTRVMASARADFFFFDVMIVMWLDLQWTCYITVWIRSRMGPPYFIWHAACDRATYELLYCRFWFVLGWVGDKQANQGSTLRLSCKIRAETEIRYLSHQCITHNGHSSLGLHGSPCCRVRAWWMKSRRWSDLWSLAQTRTQTASMPHRCQWR